MKREYLLFLTTVLLVISCSTTIQKRGECVSGDCDDGMGDMIWSKETVWAGQKYSGQWRNGQRNGMGIYTWPHGDKYVGNWKNDKRHGMGTYIWKSGDKYVGQWKDDRKHGAGVISTPDDIIIKKGIWKSGHYKGK